MIAPVAFTEQEQAPPSSLRDKLRELGSLVSASRLGCYHTCRRKFYYRYIRELKKSTSPALHYGKVVHAVLQSWNLVRWRGQIAPEGGFRSVFDAQWAELQLGQKIRWDEKEDAQKAQAWTLLETYFSQTTIPGDEKPIAVEIQIEADLSRHGLPTVLGIIDLIRPGGRIIDFKTSATTPQSHMVEHLHETQLACYAILYREATGSKESGFELHHMVKLKTPKLVVTPLQPMSDRQQTRLFNLIESYLDGLYRQDFVPSPGMQCMSCEYFNECRKWGG